jgi:phosphohistidine phosphatase SixA
MLAMQRRALLILPLAGFAPPPPLAVFDAGWRARLAGGGHTLLIRHADTRGMGCDTTSDWRDTARQRHLSPAGRAQAQRIGQALRDIPHELPVRASPVPRALETARLAMGEAEIDPALLSDEFAAEDFEEVMAMQRALLAAPPPPGLNRLLFGHLSSAVPIGGRRPTQAEFPEGSAMVLQAGVPLAVLELAPIPGGGAHGCR